ncbi:MAG: signal peptidase II, partial [Pseudobdellovibrionaceae bacterium]|nr:signal peptidase II [Pseudobdellovibrionaceae bacterium]
MKRIEWVLVFLPFFLSWTIDRLLKLWAVNLNRHLEFGFVNFALVYNPGAIFGLFSELPPLLRVVSLSTAGIFIFCIYILLQYLMPFKSLILRGGMSLLIGGILGNVADRVLYGHVIDYIFFRFGTWSTPVFNFADGIQWLGYGMIVLSLFREGGVFWPENNSRNKYWINLPFQLKYCFFLLGVGLGISLIVSVFSYTYLRVTLLDVAGNNQNILNRYLSPFLFTFLLITF